MGKSGPSSRLGAHAKGWALPLLGVWMWTCWTRQQAHWACWALFHDLHNLPSSVIFFFFFVIQQQLISPSSHTCFFFRLFCVVSTLCNGQQSYGSKDQHHHSPQTSQLSLISMTISLMTLTKSWQSNWSTLPLFASGMADDFMPPLKFFFTCRLSSALIDVDKKPQQHAAKREIFAREDNSNTDSITETRACVVAQDKVLT